MVASRSRRAARTRPCRAAPRRHPRGRRCGRSAATGRLPHARSTSSSAGWRTAMPCTPRMSQLARDHVAHRQRRHRLAAEQPHLHMASAAAQRAIDGDTCGRASERIERARAPPRGELGDLPRRRSPRGRPPSRPRRAAPPRRARRARHPPPRPGRRPRAPRRSPRGRRRRSRGPRPTRPAATAARVTTRAVGGREAAAEGGGFGVPERVGQRDQVEVGLEHDDEFGERSPQVKPGCSCRVHTWSSPRGTAAQRPHA